MRPDGRDRSRGG